MTEPRGTWSKHFHEAYLEDAANPKYPKAIRVAFLAYGTHKANGHARFKRREVGRLLGEFDQQGTFVDADRYAVNRAINTAIEYGLLSPGSNALCLIVPGHRIQGHRGDADKRCDRHRTVAATRNGRGSNVAVPAVTSPEVLRQPATVHAHPPLSSYTPDRQVRDTTSRASA